MKRLNAAQLLRWLEVNIDELDVERHGTKTTFVLWPSKTPDLSSVEIKRASIRACVEAAIRKGCTK